MDVPSPATALARLTRELVRPDSIGIYQFQVDGIEYDDPRVSALYSGEHRTVVRRMFDVLEDHSQFCDCQDEHDYYDHFEDWMDSDYCMMVVFPKS